MKVVKAKPAIVLPFYVETDEIVLPFYVETDEEDYPHYRRNSAADWDQRMGDSWEPVYDSKELEQAFQSFIGWKER